MIQDSNTNRIIIVKSICIFFGVLLLIFSSYLQINAEIAAYNQEKINTWRVEVPIDFSNQNTYKKSFEPITTTGNFTKFIIQGPVTEEFQSYNRTGDYVSPEDTKNILSGRTFKISWSILDGEKELKKGTFIPLDVNAWVYEDYVHYQATDHFGYPQLETGHEYSLVVKIEQTDEEASELKPTIILRTAGSFKPGGFARHARKYNIAFFIMGIILIICATSKRSFIKRK